MALLRWYIPGHSLSFQYGGMGTNFVGFSITPTPLGPYHLCQTQREGAGREMERRGRLNGRRRDRGGGMEGERGGGRRPRREAGDGERRRDGATAEKREWGVTEGPEATRVDRGRGGEERRGGG